MLCKNVPSLDVSMFENFVTLMSIEKYQKAKYNMIALLSAF